MGLLEETRARIEEEYKNRKAMLYLPEIIRKIRLAERVQLICTHFHAVALPVFSGYGNMTHMGLEVRCSVIETEYVLGLRWLEEILVIHGLRVERHGTRLVAFGDESSISIELHTTRIADRGWSKKCLSELGKKEQQT
jgi:hypothetical protein